MSNPFAALESDQHKAIDFIGGGEDSLIAADVGTGKTVIALTAAKLALAKGEVSRWLVFAPLLVATDTWRKEPDEWDHLEASDLAVACGPPEQRVAAIESDARIVVTNYENLQWLMDTYEDKPLPFDGIIFDEIDKLKSVSTTRFKALRHRITEFKKRVGLTGTLVPNDLTELWGQVYMVDGGQSFGRSFYQWRKKFFYPTDFNQYNWAPFPNTKDELIDAISDLTVRLVAHGLPRVQPATPVKLQLPPEIRARYDKLETDYFLMLEDSKGVSRQVDAANAAVLVGKLQQICAGFSYVDRTKDAVWHSKARFTWLDDLITKTNDQVLIFYHFNEEKDELERNYGDAIKYLGKGVTPAQQRINIDDWNRGAIQFLALHPQSAGHGLNLQKSGAHRIAFLTMPWSGGMYKQVVGRLARRGNKARIIDVHTALFENTIDENVFNTVTGRLTGMESFLADLETAIRAET